MPTKWYQGKVIKIENASPTTKRFWIQTDEIDTIIFKAGQFITLDLPVHQKRLYRWKSYSIASPPNQDNILELCIVLLEGGLGTTYLFNEVNIGTTIKFKGPSGTFILSDNITTDLVFICTGTGIAPFRSMIKDIYNDQINNHNIHLIFGTRHQEYILYKEEFEALVAEKENFKYSVALSRAKGLKNDSKLIDWHYGYVHPIYQKQYKNVQKPIRFYLCGWSNMIDQAVENLKKMGYDNTQIHYELYG